jgi:hypothetical protein
MAQWQRTLNIKDVWESEDIQLIAQTAADRLQALTPLTDEFYWLEDKRLELVDELRGLANDSTADAEDFDEIWVEVYAWADTPLDTKWNGKKVCWVKTF